MARCRGLTHYFDNLRNGREPWNRREFCFLWSRLSKRNCARFVRVLETWRAGNEGQRTWRTDLLLRRISHVRASFCFNSKLRATKYTIDSVIDSSFEKLKLQKKRSRFRCKWKFRGNWIDREMELLILRLRN